METNTLGSSKESFLILELVLLKTFIDQPETIVIAEGDKACFAYELRDYAERRKESILRRDEILTFLGRRTENASL